MSKNIKINDSTKQHPLIVRLSVRLRSRRSLCNKRGLRGLSYFKYDVKNLKLGQHEKNMEKVYHIQYGSASVMF